MAVLIAACTSRAAPSILRPRSNCSTTWVLPKVLDEVISTIPAIRPSARSKGVATELAMVSGLAPGMAALTTIYGKSTCGSGATGSKLNDKPPANSNAKVSNNVATGRRINGVEKLMPAARH